MTLAPIVTAGGAVATNLFSLVCIALWFRLAGCGALRHPIAKPLARLREHGYRVVARREREWEYQRPQSAAGHQYIEFVDDLGTLLGSPQRGTPRD